MKDSITKLVGQDLIDSQQSITERASWYHANRDYIKEVADALTGVEVSSATMSYRSVDIHVIGNKDVLNTIFAEMRKLGYEPTSRPTEKAQSSFGCYWNHPEHDGKFWINFTSSVCKRVKVGTKTVEQDIYETVCE